jgi:hypothetical protein
MSKKKDMWKLAELGKAMKEWKPIKKQQVMAAPAAPAGGGGKKPMHPKPTTTTVKVKTTYPKDNKVKVPVTKAELGTAKETDWSKPDGAPVDLLNAVQRSSRTKAMETQGQKKEVAVFSEAQKRHMKDGGYPVEKSDIFGGWQPSRIGTPEPLKKNKK